MVSVIFRLVLFVAFVAAVVYIAPLFAQRSTAPAPTATPRPVAAATAAASGLSAGITSIDDALKQATQSGRSVAVTLRISETDLTAAAQPYFPQSYAGITVTDPAVRIGPSLTMSAKASSLLVSGALFASATPYASGGRLALRLDSATVGGIALPDVARTQLQQQMQVAIDSAMPAKLQVATVSLAQGVATITGSALP